VSTSASGTLAGALPGFREDLIFKPESFRGRKGFTVKDPVVLTYSRLGEQERYLAGLLNGQRTASQVVDEMAKKFPNDGWNAQRLAAAVQRFATMSYLKLEGTASQAVLRSNAEKRRGILKTTRLMRFLSAVLSLKIPLFDPDLLLLRMSKRLHFLWTGRAVAVLALIWTGAVYAIFSNRERLWENAPDVFNLQNLVILWILMILVKVLHEFGHGLACKHYGGEVHQMGAMFIVFSPFLFCDATDSWMFRNKWQRIVVNFAGIYLELFLAGLAAYVWVFTQPGLLHTLAFNVVLVCSVMTIFFNINPLMKFDGYYALADYWEIPNLKDRSTRAIVNGLSGLVAGRERFPRDPITEKFKWPIYIYGVASQLWTVVVFFSILGLMSMMFKPYGLDRFFAATASITLLIGVFAPFYLSAKQVHAVLKREGGDLWRTAAGRFVLLTAGLGAAIMIPLPSSLSTSCTVNLGSLTPVHAEVDGFLEEWLVEPQQRVTRGQPLARLRNGELSNQARNIEHQLRVARAAAGLATARGNTAEYREFESLLDQTEALETAYRDHLRGLQPTAPVDGVVASGASDALVGRLYERGAVLCTISPNGGAKLEVLVSEDDAARIAAGQKVLLRLRSRPWETLQGEVSDMRKVGTQEVRSDAVTQASGGDIPAYADPLTGRQKALKPLYIVELLFPDPEHELRVGMTGRAKILTGWEPVGVQFYRWFSRVFRINPQA